MTNRDRGTKKWVSIMLPEHVKMLHDFMVDDYHRVEKPTLDEQQLEEFNELIGESMEHTLPLQFTCYKDGHHYDVTGLVHYVNEVDKALYVVTPSEERLKIKLENVVKITFAT